MRREARKPVAAPAASPVARPEPPWPPPPPWWEPLWLESECPPKRPATPWYPLRMQQQRRMRRISATAPMMPPTIPPIWAPVRPPLSPLSTPMTPPYPKSEFPDASVGMGNVYASVAVWAGGLTFVPEESTTPDVGRVGLFGPPVVNVYGETDEDFGGLLVFGGRMTGSEKT